MHVWVQYGDFLDPVNLLFHTVNLQGWRDITPLEYQLFHKHLICGTILPKSLCPDTLGYTPFNLINPLLDIG